MREPQLVTGLELKALFAQLVDVCGKSTAAGAFLRISPQRVRQICSAHEDYADDLPTMMQIHRLEVVARQPIVTAYFAKAAQGDLTCGDLGKETREATYAVVDLQRAAEQGADSKSLLAGVNKARRELDDVEAVLVSEGV